MKDINNIELKAGDIVQIKNAYFKNDNGFWFIEQDGTNKAYLAHDSLTLKKIGKRGKISKAKYNLNFFPLQAYCSDREKAAAAYEWNEKNATIEKVDFVDNTEVIEEFANELKGYEESIEYYEIRGYSESYIAPYKDHVEYLRNALENLQKLQKI